MPSSERIAAAAYLEGDLEEVARQAQLAGALGLWLSPDSGPAWLWAHSQIDRLQSGPHGGRVVWTSPRYQPDRYHVIEVFPFIDVDNTGYRVIDRETGEAIRFSAQYGDATWSSKTKAEQYARDINRDAREHTPRASRA